MNIYLPSQGQLHMCVCECLCVCVHVCTHMHACASQTHSAPFLSCHESDIVEGRGSCFWIPFFDADEIPHLCFTFLLVCEVISPLPWLSRPFPQLGQPWAPIPYLYPLCLAGEMLPLSSEIQDPQDALMRYPGLDLRLFRFVDVVLGKGEGSREPAFTSFFSLVKPLLVSHSDIQALAVLNNRGAWSLPLGFCAELRTLERTSPCGWTSLPWMAPFLSHCSVFWLSRVAEKKGWLPEQLNEGVYYWWCTVLRYVASSTPQCSSPVLQWKSACSPS